MTVTIKNYKNEYGHDYIGGFIDNVQILNTGYCYKDEKIITFDYTEENQEALFLKIENIDSKLPINFFFYKKIESNGIELNLYHMLISNASISIDFYIQISELINKTPWHHQKLFIVLKEKINLVSKVYKIEQNYNEDNIYDSSIAIGFKDKFDKRLGIHFQEYVSKLNHIISETFRTLNGYPWKEEYLKNEKKFCKELLSPLFMKMKFNSVKYNHGVNEFGKDFTFNKIDEFSVVKNYAVQVKAGNLSGKSGKQIDDLISQINDAFDVPFYDINSKEPKYISQLIIIISGTFTNNAKMKIINKIPNNIRGAIYFLDKENIESLVEKYLRK